MIGNFPIHLFEGAPDADPTDPDAPCHAIFQTATEEVDGFDMKAQCGHTRAEHPPEVIHHEQETP